MTPNNPIGELMQECDEAAELVCEAMCNTPMEPVEEFRNAILAAFRARVDAAAEMLMNGKNDADLIEVPCSKFVREAAAERVRGMRPIRESGVRA